MPGQVLGSALKINGIPLPNRQVYTAHGVRRPPIPFLSVGGLMEERIKHPACKHKSLK